MRVDIERSVHSWTESYPTTSGGVRTIYQSGTKSLAVRTFTRSDITKVKMVDGWRKPTAYTSDEVTQVDPNVDFNLRYLTGAFAGLSRTYGGPAYPKVALMPPKGSPDLATLNSLYYSAVQKAKEQAINIAVTLAELGESIALIRGRSKLFGELFDLARAKRWKELLLHLGISKNYKFKNARNDVSGRWMELHFGWLPILSDIYSSIDLLGKKARNEGLMVVARSTGPRQMIVEQFNLPLGWRQSYGFYTAGYFTTGDKINTKLTRRKVEGHKVQLWFKVDSPKLQLASSLGLTNPASVLWELTRLSWFADFFVDIGNWLDALDTLGLTYVGGSGSWWYENVIEVNEITQDAKDSGSITKLRGSGGTYSRKQTERIVFVKAPAPFYLKNPFDLWKAVTTCALVSQKFR